MALYAAYLVFIPVDEAKKPLFPLYSAVFKEKKKLSKMKQNRRSLML